MLRVEECSFEDVLPVWAEKLWPGRVSVIEPASAIDEQGLTSLDISRLEPVFFRVRNGTEIVGVQSAFQTSASKVRLRGLWVDPAMRSQGIATQLVARVEAFARQKGAGALWVMPRMSARGFYERCGFRVYKTVSQYEFGPHYLASKEIGL
jgi:GNAT superfamily N-acetyltransferase